MFYLHRDLPIGTYLQFQYKYHLFLAYIVFFLVFDIIILLCSQVVDEKTSLLKAEEPSLHDFPAGGQPPSRPTSVVNYPTTGGAVDASNQPIRQGQSSDNIDKKGKPTYYALDSSNQC